MPIFANSYGISKGTESRPAVFSLLAHSIEVIFCGVPFRHTLFLPLIDRESPFIASDCRILAISDLPVQGCCITLVTSGHAFPGYFAGLLQILC